MDNAITTTHGLNFEQADVPKEKQDLLSLGIYLYDFRVGTVYGQWYHKNNELCIFAIFNSVPGNGHVKDVFEWFEFACKEQKKNMRVTCILSNEFARMLELNGFSREGRDFIKKYF